MHGFDGYILIDAIIDSEGNMKYIFKKKSECEGKKPEFIKSIPQGFSPNGDDKNEFFKIKDLETCFPTFRLRVYNRWGNLVYDYSNENRLGKEVKWWNGDSDGRWSVLGKNHKVPVGTYFYILEFEKDRGNSKDNTHQGWVYVNY